MLDDWQIDNYNDRFSVFRQDERDRDQDGEPLGVRMVEGAQYQMCKLYTTSQFDSPGAVAQSNRDNLQTSDSLRCAIEVEVRAEDLVRIDAGPDGSEWYTVAGSPLRRRDFSAFAEVFLQTTNPPTVLVGYWDA